MRGRFLFFTHVRQAPRRKRFLFIGGFVPRSQLRACARRLPIACVNFSALAVGRPISPWAIGFCLWKDVSKGYPPLPIEARRVARCFKRLHGNLFQHPFSLERTREDVAPTPTEPKLHCRHKRTMRGPCVRAVLAKEGGDLRGKPWVSPSSGALWASFSRQGEKDASRFLLFLFVKNHDLS